MISISRFSQLNIYHVLAKERHWNCGVKVVGYRANRYRKCLDLGHSPLTEACLVTLSIFGTLLDEQISTLTPKQQASHTLVSQEETYLIRSIRLSWNYSHKHLPNLPTHYKNCASIRIVQTRSKPGQNGVQNRWGSHFVLKTFRSMSRERRQWCICKWMIHLFRSTDKHSFWSEDQKKKVWLSWGGIPTHDGGIPSAFYVALFVPTKAVDLGLIVSHTVERPSNLVCTSQRDTANEDIFLHKKRSTLQSTTHT